MEIDVNLKQLVEKHVGYKIDEAINRLFGDTDYFGTTKIVDIISDKISDKFVKENYEEIIQSISKEEVSKYVLQRATLLSAVKTNDGNNNG